MKIKRCPDCSTGWCYAEDLPKKHRHALPHHHGLVKCPTCNGQGRMLEPDDTPVKATVTASGVQPASDQRRGNTTQRIAVPRARKKVGRETTAQANA